MRLKVFFITQILFFVTACGIPPYKPPPQISGLPMKLEEAQAIVAELQSAQRGIDSFRGLSQTTVLQNGQGERFRHLVVFKKPDRLRIEAFPLNAVYTLNLLVTRQGQYTFLDSVERRAEQGLLTTDLFYSMFRLRADERQFMNFLTGRISPELLGDWIGPGGVKVFFDELLNRVALVKGDFQFFWIVDAGTLRLLEFRARDLYTARELFEISYSEYREVDKVHLPARVEIYIPAENTGIQMDYSSMTVNRDYSEDLFEAGIPGGYRR